MDGGESDSAYGRGGASPDRPVIVVAGEALVDLLIEPGGRTTPQLGGGSFNAARALGRLGLAPLFIGRLSLDQYGWALRLGLEESDVRLDGVVTTEDPTTFARVEVDADGVADYQFYFDGTSLPGLRPEVARRMMPRQAGA